jgi:hypothetical protein
VDIKPPLLKVCELLNEAGAKYLICGAQACILHGLVRTTEDVDILVEPTEENCQRVIDGLARMQDGAARELTPRDILDNVVVKVADEVEVDVSTKAWKVSYGDAAPSAKQVVLHGMSDVRPQLFVGLGSTNSRWNNLAKPDTILLC